MSNTLKKCPFCGYIYTQVMHIDQEEFAVMCLNCGAYGPSELSKSRAIEMWNMRRQEYPPDTVAIEEQQNGGRDDKLG